MNTETVIQPTIDQQIAETAKRQKLEDQAARIALAAARPGPLRDVFASQQDIKVGKYAVRPFFDLDFEFLSELEHPFASFAVGNTKELEEFVPRGPQAWQLFYIMTKPVAEVDAEFIAGGPAAIKAAARKEFAQYQLGGLFALYQAVVKQLTTYASSVVGFDSQEAPDKKEDEKEAANATPKSSVPPPTAPVG